MKALQVLRSFIFLLLLTTLAPQLSAQQVFKAYLSGQNEVFPTATLAHGEVTAHLAGQKLELSGSFSGLSGDLATDIGGGGHIHLGFAGQNGGVLFPLRITMDADRRGGKIEASKNLITLTVAQMDFLLKRRFYINIHSAAFRGGEIRGQLLPLADEYYHANLFGSNEVPSVMTHASGAVDIEIRGDQMTLSGSFQNLEGNFDPAVAGGAHIHGGMAGQNGGIALFLMTTVNADSKSGFFLGARNTFTLTQAQLDAIRARRWYTNVHTTRFPGGEIRGQIVGQSRTVFRSHLAGVNEPAAVVTNGTGVALVEVVDEATIICSGSFAGLESDLATQIVGGGHIHRGLAGMNGPVEFPLTMTINADNRGGVFPAAGNRATLNVAQMNNLYGRALYTNIHSMNFIGGEIRGQLLPESPMFFTGLMAGIQEVNPVLSTGRGAVKVEFSGTRIVVSGSFSDLMSDYNPNIGGGSHIHLGYAGQNGGIAFRLTPTLTLDNRSGRFEPSNNTFQLSEDQLNDIRNRRMYVNVHTANLPAGEIRGQVLFEANNYFFSVMSGSSETNVVNTTGTGTTALEISGDRAFLTGSYRNLLSAFNPNIGGGAHIHKAIAGRNGGIELPIRATPDANNLGGVFAARDNALSFSADQVSALRDRQLYVNVHTVNAPSGEIRGQLLPPATAYFTATLNGLNETASVNTTGNGALKLELTGDKLTVSGSFNALASDYINESHLHIALPGADGAVSVRLSATVDAGNRGGMFLATNNSFTLDPPRLTAIRGGEMYANVHSTDTPSGEIRGQVLPEINFFPTAATMSSPEDGAHVTIEGGAAEPFEFIWNDAFDDNNLVYQWQLSTTPDFSNIILQSAVGNALSYVTDIATMDALLETLGVPVGGHIALYHRANSSDGSLRTNGVTATIHVTRGMLDGTKPFGNWNAQFESSAKTIRVTGVFPNPAIAEVTVELTSETESAETLQAFDVQGRLIFEQPMDVFDGTNRFHFDVSDWKDGIYFLKLANTADAGATWRLLKSSKY